MRQSMKFGIIRLSISTAFRQANPFRARRLPLLTTRTCFCEKFAAQLAELNGKISSIGLQPSGSPLPERQGASAAVLRSIGTQELQEWSPTQEDVDAYVDSLEHEVSEESVLMRQCQGEERRAAAPTKARHSNVSVLFWCAMATAIACLGWLLQIIYDSLK